MPTAATLPPGRATPHRPARPVATAAAIELSIATAVFVAYRAGRLVTNDSVSAATANADRVIELERSIGAFVEQAVQRWMLEVPGAIDVLNHYYVYVHFPATTAFLVWVFARHRHHYPAIRNWFTGVTLVAMVVHVVYPLAPPRMTDGFVDTLDRFGPSIYPADTSRSVANQFAAMPSLHFGWALMVAVGLVVLVGRGPWRWLWLLHPTITLVAIVATGNHYWIDAAVAAGLAAAVGVTILQFDRRRRRFEAGSRAVPGVPHATNRQRCRHRTTTATSATTTTTAGHHTEPVPPPRRAPAVDRAAGARDTT